jgi:hypothetical protein
VVDGPDGRAIACFGLSYRNVFVEGEPTRVAYVGDLKVDPQHRTKGMAKALARWAYGAVLDEMGADFFGYATVLRGNAAVMGLFDALTSEGGLGIDITQVGTIRSHSIPLLWRRRSRDSTIVVDRASKEDLDEMVSLWQQVAPTRQFAPVHDAESFVAWTQSAPGLDISDYLVARRGNGRIAGFLGIWDQHQFKQMKVVDYSKQLRPIRSAFNVAASPMGVPPLPPPGGEVQYRTVVNVCVPGVAPEVLRALLLGAYGELRTGGYSLLTIGLDVRDPLAAALRGLLAQPTDVEAWVITPAVAGDARRPPLDTKPLHFEIALV